MEVDRGHLEKMYYFFSTIARKIAAPKRTGGVPDRGPEMDMLLRRGYFILHFLLDIDSGL